MNKNLISVKFAQESCLLSHEYRDRIYIRKDILLKLAEYTELNQTSLLSYCGLNLMKHKDILEGLEKKGFITKTEEPWGSKKIIKFTITQKGRDFSSLILEPYEEVFPRKEKETNK